MLRGGVLVTGDFPVVLMVSGSACRVADDGSGSRVVCDDFDFFALYIAAWGAAISNGGTGVVTVVIGIIADGLSSSCGDLRCAADFNRTRSDI